VILGFILHQNKFENIKKKVTEIKDLPDSVFYLKIKEISQ
jgi:hypothetical protein